MLQRGPTRFKEGLRTSKRAYVLQREPTYFKEGLHTLKRAYMLQRGPTYFKEGLRTSRRRPTVFKEGQGLRTSTGVSVLLYFNEPIYVKSILSNQLMRA